MFAGFAETIVPSFDFVVTRQRGSANVRITATHSEAERYLGSWSVYTDLFAWNAVHRDRLADDGFWVSVEEGGS
jgi:hypothetical protein